MPVCHDRINTRLADLARIGGTPEGGVTRVSLTPEYLEARDRVADWLKAAGMHVRIDTVGNLIGRRDGLTAGAPALAIGSHIDTVLDGGRYDGALGVLAGVEVAQALHEDGVELYHPLEVIAFVEEESTRWSLSLLGSRVMSGQVQPEDVLSRVDRAGVSMADGMRLAGLQPDRFMDSVREPKEFAAYLELHVEQASVLDSMGLPVGVVTGIAGPLFLGLHLKGRTDHAGATPMNLRRDALVGAAHLVLAAKQIAFEAGSTAVATVGRLEVKPGATNAVPGEVFMTFDLRDIHESKRDFMERELKGLIGEVAAQNELESTLEVLSRVRPTVLPQQMVETIKSACRAADVPVYELPSGAGHDAQAMADVTSVGMIFVRSRDGVSHSPYEYSSPEDITQGTRVLRESVMILDAHLSSGNAPT